ncbi:MAG: NAD(P)-binding domain-containing protein [Sandaracinaceae bacterium]|nr:NAD(P)-binding domain-containing protein [Sandaracinaceae bacterium]
MIPTYAPAARSLRCRGRAAATLLSSGAWTPSQCWAWGSSAGASPRTLLSKGRSVRVWNRTASRMEPLVAAGALGASTPAGAVAGASRVHLVLSEDSAVDGVIEAMKGAARRGHLRRRSQHEPPCRRGRPLRAPPRARGCGTSTRRSSWGRATRARPRGSCC